MKVFIAAAILASTVSADFGGWSGGGWGGPNNCASNCSDLISSAWDKGFKSFCTNSASVSAAYSCIGDSNCAGSDKSSATSSISSLCSAASTWESNWHPTGTAGGYGPWGTGAGPWSGWKTITNWPEGGPWTAGGPFGGQWGPFGTSGPWTTGGPWTNWWGKSICPGSEWPGWTSGSWSKTANWTTWADCTATTSPVVVTATANNGSTAISTSFVIQVAQVTNNPSGSQPTAASTSSAAKPTGAAAPFAGGPIPVEVGIIGAVFAGFIGIIGVL